MLKVCECDRLLLVLWGLHRLLQRCVHYANEVPCQIWPSSPTRAVLLLQPIGHQGLRTAEKLKLPQTERMWSSKKQLATGTSKHVLDKPTQFFEATLTESFHGVRIPSVTSRLSCSKNKSDCYSHETLFSEATCGCKRRFAVHYALNSGVGKHLAMAASRLVPTHIHTLVHASRLSGRTFKFVHSSQSSWPLSSMRHALLGFLFLETDLLLEVRILDDLVQSRSNLRV